MQTEYRREYAAMLGREIEYKVYGHAGRPVLFFPCMGGRFFDFENFRMTGPWTPWLESGQVQVFAVDTVDNETLAAEGPVHGRIAWYDRWIHCLAEELLPRMKAYNTACSGRDTGRFTAFGCSLGALHAAVLFFRFPDLFDSVLGLSGVYDLRCLLGEASDALVYENSPTAFLSGMSADHPYIRKYNDRRMIFCVGQGRWEEETLETTADLQRICEARGIHPWVDYWGYDVDHDWPWWLRQCDYFLPRLFGEPV